MRRKECGKDGCLWRHGAAFTIALLETGTDLRVGPWGFMTKPSCDTKVLRNSEYLSNHVWLQYCTDTEQKN